MSERKYKAGEVIEAVAYQEDAAGDTISEVTVKWYGFANADANEATMQLVRAIAGVADGWRVEKSGKPSGANR